MVRKCIFWFIAIAVGRAHDRVADLPEGRMSRIRILIGGMPRMLRDIVGDAIARQPDMELVASGEPTELATTIARQQPDAVILAEEGPGLNVARVELAFGVGRLRILVLTGAGREAHWVELQQIAVSEVSPQGLVETIRSHCS